MNFVFSGTALQHLCVQITFALMLLPGVRMKRDGDCER
jgi:hypothetical protein